MSSTPSSESLALNDLVGKLIKHGETKGSVAEAVVQVIMQLKEEAKAHTPVGNLVISALTKLATQKDDPLFEGMPMLERATAMQMAYMAVKVCE